MDEGSLPGAFRSPPADYGPAPLLVFNDEHERMVYGGLFRAPRWATTV